MDTKNTKGFTLIELIIALSILSILSAYAIPSYMSFSKNQTMTNQINRLASTINFARNQSVTMAQHIILCPSQSYSACDSGSEWSQGWMVFADINRDRDFDQGDLLLLTENVMTNQLTAMSSTYRSKIRYDQAGFSPGTNLSIKFCDSRGAEYGKAIIISNVGRPRIAKHIENCG